MPDMGPYSNYTLTVRLELRSEEHTSELQSQSNLVCRLLLEKKKHSITQDAPAVTHPVVRSRAIISETAYRPADHSVELHIFPTVHATKPSCWLVAPVRALIS